MAQVEPLDVDAIESDFDNKENAFHNNKKLPRTPCTEKGYEELDVSELNMKLRYSITPASSPMSKSLTVPSLDNRNSEDYLNNAVGIAENGNLTRSLNSTLTKTECLTKSKNLPLQPLSTDLLVDNNRNSSMSRLLDSTDNNVIISVNNANDIDENLSLPSACSSVPETPEATTPTKENPKPEGSPIMRGLKSVLSMFRPSQSPILPADDKFAKTDNHSPVQCNKSEIENVQVSTPVTANKHRDSNSSKRSSPLKESLIFNDDLERELLWKDETTIIFKEERIPVHKLFFQNPIPDISTNSKTVTTAVEHMDISSDQCVSNEHPIAGESDNEFLDCETTFTKNESYTLDFNKLEMDNKQVTEIATTDLSINAENTRGMNSDCQNIPISSDCITSREETTICQSQASVSVTAIIPKIDKSIEATISLLRTEINDYNEINQNHGVDFQSKYQANEELQLNKTNIVHIEEQALKHYDQINGTETSPFAIDNVQNVIQDVSTFKSLESEEIQESEHQRPCNVNKNNLPDICAESSNSIHNLRGSSIETNTIDTKEKTEIVIEPVKDMNVSNIIQSNVSNKLDSMVELQSNTDTLFNNIEVVANVLHITHNSNNVGHSLSENEKKVEDMPITQTTKDETNIFRQADIEMTVDNENFKNASYTSDSFKSIINDHHKTIDDLRITQATTIAKDIDTINLSSHKKLINVIDTSTVHYDLNDVLNVTSTQIPSKDEANNTNRSNDENIEDISEDKKEALSLPMQSEESGESKANDIMQISYVLPSANSVINSVLDHDREVPEIIIENEAAVFNSPAEISLPDEDDIEQNILVSNGINNEQDVNNYTNNIKNSKMDAVDIESELVDLTSCNQATVILNNFQENNAPNIEEPINEKIIGLTNNTVTQDAENTQNDIIIGNLRRETMERDQSIIDLQILENNIKYKENLSKNLCKSEEMSTDMEHNVAKMKVAENKENTIIHEKVSNNIEDKSCNNDTDLVKTEKNGDINNVDKTERMNQVNIRNDVQKDFTSNKGVDEIDDEIITSANNSPFVSVTDVDIVAQNIVKDNLEEIDNSDIKNTKFASSPPISPKIVSKGYNFNFDDIADPFTTKTKIRMSPTPDTPNECFATSTKDLNALHEVPKKNRRKSQIERKKPVQKKKMDFTINDKLTSKDSPCVKSINFATDATKNDVSDNISLLSSKQTILERNIENCCVPGSFNNSQNQKLDNFSESAASSTEQVSTSVAKEEISSHDEEIPSHDEEIKNLEQTLVISTEKSTSSSEQYFSLGTSSGESSGLMNRSKNVFNLPEIDDVNFNPFATKSKMRMSPPPTENIRNATKSSIAIQQQSPPSQSDTELTINSKNVNDSSFNTSNTTCYSKNINDTNSTVREIHTEDEDTVEGPFLEVDELGDSQKATDLDVENDMMNFEDVPHQERDENVENGELFIDADAFEFLLNQNKSTTVLDSGKESLFLKFDPLFAKRVSSDGILAALSKVQKRQSTPKKVTKSIQKEFSPEKSAAGPSNVNESCCPIEEYNEDMSSTITKPMMVVNPAVSSIITQKKTATPKLNRRSLTFTSPAMAVIDRLLSLSGNSSHLEHDASIPQIGRDHSETDVAITQLRELLAEKEINVHTLRCESKELKDRLAALEVQVRGLESESAERLAKINELNGRLTEKTKMNKSMAIVVEEYERTIASLIAETEQDKKRNAEERMRLIKERDEQTAHLTSMEVSFSDLHSKYEKSKQIILSCKANEDIYKKSIKEFQDNFSKMQNNYELLKQHATSKLNHANQELEKMNRAHEAEVLKLNAMIKRKELHITSLEETLAQKTKANEELTAICDELINKVG